VASEVQVLVWCDVHLQQHQERVEAAFSDDVTIGGRTAHVDLCDDCETEFALPMFTIVRDYGSPSGTKATPAAARKPAQQNNGGRPKSDELTVECPECHRPYKNRSSLSVHIQKEHHLTLAVAEGGGDHVRLRCPECIATMKSLPALEDHVRTQHPDFYDAGFDAEAYVATLPDRGGLDKPQNGVDKPQAAQQELVGAGA
jgi:uncharacterized C2H2 Zn-finger protein